MAGRCKEGEHFDGLTKSCTPCRMVCWQPHVFPRCANYCESARCTVKPGHYFDRVVKKCMRCEEICGKHPAECSQYCSTLPPPVTTKRLLAVGTKQAGNIRAPPELASSILLYSFLAVCMALLLSSLGLALVVFLRGGKTKSNDTKTAKAEAHKQNGAVQPEKKFGFLSTQTGRSYKDFKTNSSYPTHHEPSDDSNPIETCVCVHCFPDLRVLSQDNSRPQRTSYPFYQQAVVHSTHIQKGGHIWNGRTLHGSGQEVQEEATMG